MILSACWRGERREGREDERGVLCLLLLQLLLGLVPLLLSYLLADVELRLTRTITLSLEERLDLTAARDKHADQARKDASVERTIRDLGEWHDAL